MYKAKLIWIATHSKEPSNFEVSLTEPGSGVWLYAEQDCHENECVKAKQYVIIEVETPNV